MDTTLKIICLVRWRYKETYPTQISSTPPADWVHKTRLLLSACTNLPEVPLTSSWTLWADSLAQVTALIWIEVLSSGLHHISRSYICWTGTLSGGLLLISAHEIGSSRFPWLLLEIWQRFFHSWSTHSMLSTALFLDGVWNRGEDPAWVCALVSHAEAHCTDKECWETQMRLCLPILLGTLHVQTLLKPNSNSLMHWHLFSGVTTG